MKKITCSYCGTEFQAEPEKTWTLTSLPDKNGNITVTIMAIWKCPQCGRKIRGVYAKYKTGAETRGKTPRERLIEILNAHDKISLDDISKQLGFRKDAIRKAIQNLLKQGLIKGKLENDTWIKEP